MLAIKRHGHEIGICFFKLTTLKFYVGQLTNDELMSNFKTLICQICPVKVIHKREMVNSDNTKMLKNRDILKRVL